MTDRLLCTATDCEHEWGCGDLRTAYEQRDAARRKLKKVAGLMRADIAFIIEDEHLDADDTEDHEQIGMLNHYADMLEDELV